MEPERDLELLMHQVGVTSNSNERRRHQSMPIPPPDEHETVQERPRSAPYQSGACVPVPHILISPPAQRCGAPLAYPTSPSPAAQQRRILGTEVREARRAPNPKRKRIDPAEEAVAVLKSIAEKKSPVKDAVVAENDYFFRMIACKVSRLPIAAQDSVRQAIYTLVAEEQNKH